MPPKYRSKIPPPPQGTAKAADASSSNLSGRRQQSPHTTADPPTPTIADSSFKIPTNVDIPPTASISSVATQHAADTLPSTNQPTIVSYQAMAPTSLVQPTYTAATKTNRRFTKSKNSAAFDHVMELWDIEPSSPIFLALEEAECREDVRVLDMLSEQDIRNLTYPFVDSNGVIYDRPVKHARISGLLARWQGFIAHRIAIGNELRVEDYTSVTIEEYEDYIYKVFMAKAIVNIPSIPSTTHVASTTPAELFRKGIKRDAAVYPVLKQDSQFDTWNRATLAYAKAQDCSNVFDPSYIPLGRDNVDLFELQNGFIYSIFVSNLQTDVGRKLVRNHTDAQLIYRELVAYYEKSNRASLDGAQLLEYVTSVRLDDNWRGTTQAFVLHLQEQFRQLRRVTPQNDHLSVDVERALVENAVRAVPALHMVKTQAKTIQATTAKKLDSDAYFTLLIDAAIEHDSVTATPSRLRRNPIRAAHFHELDHTGNYGEEFYDNNSPYDLDYNIDTPLDVIQSNVHSRTPPRSTSSTYVPPSTFAQLSEEGRELWTKMSPADRALIFDLKGKSTPNFSPSPRVPGQASGRPPDGQPSNRRNVNLHEISAYDFIVMQHEFNAQSVADSTPATPNTPTATTNGNSAPDTSTVSVNSTNVRRAQLSLAPSDIRRVMGSQSAKKVTINGEPIYNANAHEMQTDSIVYKVNFHSIHPIAPSLVESDHTNCGNPSNIKLDYYTISPPSSTKECPDWSWDIFSDEKEEEEIVFDQEDVDTKELYQELDIPAITNQVLLVQKQILLDNAHNNEHTCPFFHGDLPPIRPPPEPDP
jgi:hypothetical protein